MIIILKRYETKRLKHSIRCFVRRAEDFGHAVHRPGLRLEGNFDEITLPERTGQIQQAAGHGNGLEFSFSAPAIF